MKKILLVFTGGTIGSRVTAGEIQVHQEGVYQLLDAYEKKHPGGIKTDILEPYLILSEDCSPVYWTDLIQALNRVDFSAYDGVIVTHGSDTLPYTAALLGYCFSWIPVPMLLVSSNYAPEEPESNALANFEAAMDFIWEDQYAGVFVIYKNKEEPLVFLPTRLEEADAYKDRFTVYGYSPLGSMVKGHFCYENRKENPPLEAFLKEKERERPLWTMVELMFENRVLKVQPYPGLDYETLCLKEDTAAVFHGAYHSGTVCTKGTGYDVRVFIKQCEKRGIPFFFGPVKKSEKQYATVYETLEAGAHPVYDCSAIAAYMKLQLACNQKEMSVFDFMEQNLYYERIER